MEFKKENIFTAVNADELRPGDKVIVAYNIGTLRWSLNYERIESLYKEIVEIKDENQLARFVVKAVGHDSKTTDYALAYLVERKENCTNCGTYCVGHLKGDRKIFKCKDYKPKTTEINTKLHLCSSCQHSVAECPATESDIKFGDGVGNDNIYECSKYKPKTEKMTIDEAIAHCREKNCEGACKAEHEQLAEWLEELKAMKAEKKKWRPFRDTNELIKVWEKKCQRYGVYGWQDEIEMPLIWIKHKKYPIITLISGFHDTGIDTSVSSWVITWEELLNSFTLLDGSPCGVEE